MPRGMQLLSVPNLPWVSQHLNCSLSFSAVFFDYMKMSFLIKSPYVFSPYHNEPPSFCLNMSCTSLSPYIMFHCCYLVIMVSLLGYNVPSDRYTQIPTSSTDICGVPRHFFLLCFHAHQVLQQLSVLLQKWTAWTGINTTLHLKHKFSFFFLIKKRLWILGFWLMILLM